MRLHPWLATSRNADLRLYFNFVAVQQLCRDLERAWKSFFTASPGIVGGNFSPEPLNSKSKTKRKEIPVAPCSKMYAAVAVLCVLSVNAVLAAEVRVLCAVGMQTAMEELGPKFERSTGHKLVSTFDTGGATIKRASGEPADVVIAIREGVAGLAKDGRVVPDTVAAIASTGVSVAVRKGSAKPDIGSPELLKQALLSAKSITYLNPADGGASGIHFSKVLDRLGIANEIKSKTNFAPKASALGPMVASGEAEIGVLQYQLLYGVPGIEIIGPLPGDLQSTTLFSAALMASSSNPAAAKELLAFLRTAEAATAIRAKGMDSVSQ